MYLTIITLIIFFILKSARCIKSSYFLFPAQDVRIMMINNKNMTFSFIPLSFLQKYEKIKKLQHNVSIKLEKKLNFHLNKVK